MKFDFRVSKEFALLMVVMVLGSHQEIPATNCFIPHIIICYRQYSGKHVEQPTAFAKIHLEKSM
jgi:hypothetical protein